MSNKPSELPRIPERYLTRLLELSKLGKRVMIGLVGAPGAGKSTVAEAL